MFACDVAGARHRWTDCARGEALGLRWMSSQIIIVEGLIKVKLGASVN